MKKITIALLLGVMLFTGCASLEQQNTLGASANKDEGFSGFGTNRAKYLEGPLTDMMVPDDAPKGRAGLAEPIARDNLYTTPERNLGFEEQGTNRAGARIVDVRPGSLHDNYLLRDNPHMKRRSIGVQQSGNGSLEEEIRNRIMAIEKTNHVYVVNDKNIVLIGVESSEMNRRKLKTEIERTIEDLKAKHTELDFKITTDRQHVWEIRELDHGTQMLDTPMER